MPIAKRLFFQKLKVTLIIVFHFKTNTVFSMIEIRTRNLLKHSFSASWLRRISIFYKHYALSPLLNRMILNTVSRKTGIVTLPTLNR